MTGISNIRIIFLTTLAIAATAIGTSLTAAPARPSAQAVIAARQAGFKKMGAAMKALNDQLKSDAPEKATMVGAAQTILAVAHEQGTLFPAGSDIAAGVKTDALPSIWSDRGTFDEQMSKLVGEADKLVAATSGGDITAIRAQARATGAVCGGCHRQFRSDS